MLRDLTLVKRSVISYRRSYLLLIMSKRIRSIASIRDSIIKKSD
jgi:hypothetical protein